VSSVCEGEVCAERSVIWTTVARILEASGSRASLTLVPENCAALWTAAYLLYKFGLPFERVIRH